MSLDGQGTNNSGQSDNVNERNERLLETEEEGGPGEVEAERDPVEVESLDGGVSGGRVDGAVEAGDVEVLGNQVRTETGSGVELKNERAKESMVSRDS